MEINRKSNNIDTINGNFSVYIDNQFKTSPPNEDILDKYIQRIYPKYTKEWIDSNIVINCNKCDLQFRLWNKKHHCRACGGVFCSECCNKYINIPHSIECPLEETSLKVTFNNIIRKYKYGDKKLVCIDCYNKIKNLIKIDWIIKICEFLDVKDLYNTLLLNKEWHNSSIHYLSKFRNIQYINDNKYTSWEINILWNMKEYLFIHTNWIIVLFRTIIYSYIVHNKKDRLIYLSKISKKVSCWSLMCSRKCKINIDLIDILELLQFVSKINNNSNIIFWSSYDLKKFFINLFKEYKKNDSNTSYQLILLLSITLRMLFKNANYIDDEFIFNILDILSDGTYNYYFCLTLEYTYLNKIDNFNQNIILLSNLHSENNKNNDLTRIKLCDIFNNYLSNKLNSNCKSNINKTFNFFKTIINKNNIKIITSFLPIIYPFNEKYNITNILTIEELQSNSKPLLIKVQITNNKNNNKKKIKRIIVKKDFSLRKENIVSTLMEILLSKLKIQSYKGRINHFDDIPTYKIYMITNDIGIIEYVENSITLRKISLNNYTIQNYILENNPDEIISNIKDKFFKSLAISSCLSYILGLGDRHLDNIMINKKGLLFHIDYGYLMENPITNIFGAPIIRVTNEMIDFLGGINSSYYQQFKEYITNVFDIMRLYTNIILMYYHILGYENIIKWDEFKKKISNRFLNGISCKDIEIKLISEIEISTNSYSGIFIDICHHYSDKFKNIFSS